MSFTKNFSISYGFSADLKKSRELILSRQGYQLEEQNKEDTLLFQTSLLNEENISRPRQDTS